MLNLSRLSTSLTKHGAHKIALLIRDHDPDKVLSLLWGKVPGINIEEVQARKNLSAGTTGLTVPSVWKEAKARGSETINALVLIAIIFSHHTLIAAMRQGAKSDFTGRITRDVELDGKAYTNFAHTLEELGYSTKHTQQYVDFDLQRLFKIPDLNSLALTLLALKMKTAGWDGTGDLKQLLIDNGFHEVFATDEDQFEAWLSSGKLTAPSFEDADYFLDAAKDSAPAGKYKFKAGHKTKQTGSVSVKSPLTKKTAQLLHNYIQNKFDEQLVAIHGRDCVGCEVATGLGTSIDVVVETAKLRWFYEIKVGKTLKACIRQAIPQLLEYAYWSAEPVKVDRLVIVAVHKLDKQSETYLQKLRDDFKLPLYYEQFVDA
ncbi:hypothetical protein [Ramlibacter pallidus]|uniref:Uncharacterized protein n=1 Tax=Ramlibacter pallidus TaxID=2780087 RepID=A0ABR9S2H3_9BURK|nr:hypothetical protein [Ramlibacter pallidus]MBE7367680.1 hypothetical protein [Ramlibacter pallidus]